MTRCAAGPCTPTRSHTHSRSRALCSLEPATSSVFDLVDARARLVLFDGTEELVEIALAEAATAGRLSDGLVRLWISGAANALNDLEEERRTVANGLRKSARGG